MRQDCVRKLWSMRRQQTRGIVGCKKARDRLKNHVFETMTQLMKKTIAVGNSSFVTLMEEENYYVDKTASIKALMESGHAVEVIT